MSHYIPIFCERNGQKQRSVCGVWIRQDEHSASPDCDICQRWLNADAVEAAKFSTVEEQADALFGTPDRTAPITLNTFSSTAGYRLKGVVR